MTLHLVDVSRWQVERPDPLRLDAAQAAGFSIANIALNRYGPAGGGFARAYAEQARTLGMGLSTYWYLTDLATGTAQAAEAWQRIQALGGPAGMAHAVDCESTATWEHWRAYVAAMQQLLGRPIAAYTGRWWWQPRGWAGADLTPYLWAAPNGGYLPGYPGDHAPQWSAGYGGWDELAVMQHTVAPLPGTGNCSLSAIRAGYVWQALTTGETGMRVPGIPYVQGRNSYPDPDGTKFGVAIHNTSNDATAEGEASYASRRTDGVSAHLYVDADSVIQSLDTAARAGHAGSSTGNNNAVAVEITGTNDKSRDWWLSNVAWDKLGAALAPVCRHYAIAPRRASVGEMQANPKVRAFYSHDDMRRAWGGTDHTDPGPNFPWDKLFAAVNAALGGGGDDVLESSKAGVNTHDRVYAMLTMQPYGAATDNDMADYLRGLGAKLDQLLGRAPVTDEQLAALAERLAHETDAATIKAALAEVLREGVGQSP